MSMFCLCTEEKWSSTCPRGSGKGGWADDDHRGLWCIPLPGGSKPLQGLHHCLPVMSFSSGHVHPPSLSFPHILALHQRVTPHLWLRDWKSLSPPAALGGQRQAPGCSFLGWFLLPPHTSLRAPGILGSLVRPCHTTWTPHTSDDFWISLCPTHKWETRWRPWGKGLAMERMQWLKSPQLHVTAVPRIWPPKGTCLGQGRMSDGTAGPHPGPQSHTRHGWRVQGAVWGRGVKPRLTLPLSDLGLPRRGSSDTADLSRGQRAAVSGELDRC